MTRKDIEEKVKDIFSSEFRIADVDFEADLGDEYDFDSIDAIDMLVVIEQYLGSELSVEEKKQAIEIRNCNQICDYIEALAKTRGLFE